MFGKYLKRIKERFWPLGKKIGIFNLLKFTVNGHKIYLNPLDDSVSRKSFIRKRHEVYEANLMKEVARNKEGTFFDIGAHVGIFTVLLAESSPNSEVYAFEPSSENLYYLLKNCRNRRRVHIVPLAISDRIFPLKLQLSDYNRGDHRIWGKELSSSSEFSMAVSLNEIMSTMSLKAESLRLLKMDTQGCEPEIIYSLKPFLPVMNDCYLFVEYWIRGLKERNVDLQSYQNYIVQNFSEIYLIDPSKKKTFNISTIEDFDIVQKLELSDTLTLVMSVKGNLKKYLENLNYI